MDYVSEVLTALIKHGWSLTTIGIALTALLRVNGVRRIILRRLPKRFRQEDRLERIERKLDAIAAHTGVSDWKSGASTTLISGPTNSKPSLTLLQAATYQVNQLRRKEPMKINKVILIPLLTAVVDFVKQSTGYEVPGGDNIDALVDAAFRIIEFAGIFIHPRKKEDDIDNAIFASIESSQ